MKSSSKTHKSYEDAFKLSAFEFAALAVTTNTWVNGH